MSNKPQNPKIHNPSGMYAADAMREPSVTLRDHFAGLAMQGHIASEYYVLNGDRSNYPALASEFYALADAMLAEREKEVTNG